MTITIAWLNQSSGDLTDVEAQLIVEALNLQAPDLKAGWDVDVTNVFVADVSAVPAGAEKAYFLQNADVAGALGYHDVDPQGDPYIRVFTETCKQAGGTALTGSESIAVCASHEMCELAVDPGCQENVTAPDGRVWAKESADPVENDSYTVTLTGGTQVSVSNFVLPSFFEANGAMPLDHLGKLSSPFSIAPGGYAIINQQATYGSTYPNWRTAMKDFPASRTYKRTAAHRQGRPVLIVGEHDHDAPAGSETDETHPGQPGF